MVFGTRQREARSHGELFRDELGETFGHLRQAAMHGASGIGMAMGPRMNAARNIAMRTGGPALRRKKRERQMARRRRGYGLAGLLAAGAAAGTASALMRRRQRRSDWEEYEATQPPPASATPAEEQLAPIAPPEAAVGISGVGSLADQARDTLAGPEDTAIVEADALAPIVEPSRTRRT